ncbi:MAG: SDR family NAD(P)-dependent oxidoreductase [Lentisphaeria bacterium]
MHYLITGGAGFIGSHLAESLIAAGHEVAVIDDLSTGSLKNLAAVRDHRRLHFLKGDIADCPELESLVADADSVFHLAAAVGVDLVIKNPVRTIETNVHGTEEVFKHAGRHNTQVILASTSEVYGRADNPLFRETDDLLIGPPTHFRWSYAASKALDEYLALAYHKENKLKPVIARLFNTVGPRQTGKYGMVLPRFVQQALSNEPVTVYGDGEQTRCFCHVHDTVRALIALERTQTAIGQIFNIGSQHSVSINELAELVLAETDSESERRHIPYDKAYEPGFEDMHRRMPAIDKIREYTDWEPFIPLAQVIQDVIAEHRS